MRKIFFVFLALFVFVSVQAVQAAVLFTDLGTAAPPATVSTYTLIPFDQAPQAAIPNGTDVTTIPGCPVSGTLATTASVNKRTIGVDWMTWSHGYTGVVYMGGDEIVLNLPPNTHAFYFYAEPDSFSSMVISAVTDSGTSSGDINVNGNAGANGFAFYTDAGESITAITVETNDTYMAIGEFGIAQAAEPAAIPTMNEWGLIILSLLVAGSAIVMIKQNKTAC